MVLCHSEERMRRGIRFMQLVELRRQQIPRYACMVPSSGLVWCPRADSWWTL